MSKDLTKENAIKLGIDLSSFHEPDRKWRNYYIEDTERNLLFLVPSYMAYGIIVIDLDWAKTARFTTGDGAIHMFKDYAWNMTSNVRRTSYVKTTVTDRSIKCGRKTIVLGLLVMDKLYNESDSVNKLAVNYINGNTLDNRKVNLSYGILKENNDSKYSSEVPTIKYPCKVWW